MLLSCNEPCSDVPFVSGIFYLEPLIVRADLCFTTRFCDGELVIDRHTFDQGCVTDDGFFRIETASAVVRTFTAPPFAGAGAAAVVA